jgi:hypothetical protein
MRYCNLTYLLIILLSHPGERCNLEAKKMMEKETRDLRFEPHACFFLFFLFFLTILQCLFTNKWTASASTTATITTPTVEPNCHNGNDEGRCSRRVYVSSPWYVFSFLLFLRTLCSICANIYLMIKSLVLATPHHTTIHGHPP